MRRQQLRRAVKRVFIGQIGGGDWVESKLTCGSILKPLPTVVGGNLPTFVAIHHLLHSLSFKEITLDKS